MISIDALTYRIEGRLLLDGAAAAIPDGHKVGLVGRNGSGKTTLLRLVTGEIAPESGSISKPRGARIGGVAQEAPSGPMPVIDYVLSADRERAELLARAETALGADEISEIQLRLTDIGAHTAPARAATILHGLGFTTLEHGAPVEEFSGGWRMRIALASLLLSEPDILLLDEPTNYLDLEGTIWLEQYIRRYPHTVIMVSHDRDLLNSAVGGILHLDKGKLRYFNGGYDAFERTLREQQVLQMKLRQKQETQRAHMQSFVDRFRYKAKKARMAQSRIKALERMEPIAALVEDRVVPFVFPAPEKALAPPLLNLEQVAVGYEEGKPVLERLNLRIDPDDRIGLLGANGNGKSTFAKLISERLAPMSGNIIRARKVRVGYFAQHQLDELDASRTAYDYIRELLPGVGDAQRRARLGQFGFGVDKADTKVENLSGGEKARLLFALAAFDRPHILILDEPTNHLDVDSRQALVQALNEYEGAVILISHDRHLIETSADELWLCDKGTVRGFDGDLGDYRRYILNRGNAEDISGDVGASLDAGQPKASAQKRRSQAAQARERLKPLKKTIQVYEGKLLKLRDNLARIDAKFGNTSLYSESAQEAEKLARERAQCERDISELEERWLHASAEYEERLAETG